MKIDMTIEDVRPEDLDRVMEAIRLIEQPGTPEAEAADRKEHTPFLVGWPDKPTTPTSSERTLAIEAAQARKISELTTARDAIAQQMVKAENEANDLRDDNADLADENQELTQRVDELGAELAESELHAARLEKHNLALQSANTALRTRTLKTGVKIPDIGETVEALSLRLVDALPIGARFRDFDGDTIRVVRDGVIYETLGGKPHIATRTNGALSGDGPFTRIANTEASDA